MIYKTTIQDVIPAMLAARERVHKRGLFIEELCHQTGTIIDDGRYLQAGALPRGGSYVFSLADKRWKISVDIYFQPPIVYEGVL